MPATRTLPAILLSSLICTLSAAGLGLAAAPASASSPTAQPGVSPPRAVEAARRHGARAGCASRPAPPRLGARLCQTSARKPRAQRPSRRRRSQAAPATPTTPATSPAPTATPTSEGPPAPSGDVATIATVLATPCQNTELTPEAGNIALVREAILCLINRRRAESGESPLQPNPELEQAAEGHCQELIADDYFAHVSPSGETPVQRIRDTGYIPSATDGYVIGENLAWGTYQLSTPKSIVAAWIASPAHLANILEARYRQTGIGVTPAVPASLGAGAPGATYAQEFGVIIE